MLKIGTKLRQLRTERGFSQEEIADGIGMTQGNYSKLESDKYESFSWDFVPKLAKIYGLEITDILPKESNQHINMSKNKDNAVNAFLVLQDSERMCKELNTALQKIIDTQQMVINSLTEQNSMLKIENQSLK